MQYNEHMTTVGDQLKAAILASGETRYAIAKATGVAQATLHRFVVSGRGLRIDSVNALAAHLNLKLAPTKHKAAKPKVRKAPMGGK